MVCELDPTGVESRTKREDSHRNEFEAHGPNFLWSVDGYCKLQFCGIEIYAAIDAYSRNIIWAYTGITACTTISVLSQYVSVTKEAGKFPKFIRSDKGVETTMMASAHHAYHKDKSYEPIEFEQCFLYGTSTNNQRIESWWGRLSKGRLFRWRVSVLIFITIRTT